MSESLGFKNMEIKRKYAQFNWIPQNHFSKKRKMHGFIAQKLL